MMLICPDTQYRRAGVCSKTVVESWPASSEAEPAAASAEEFRFMVVLPAADRVLSPDTGDCASADIAPVIRHAQNSPSMPYDTSLVASWPRGIASEFCRKMFMSSAATQSL